MMAFSRNLGYADLLFPFLFNRDTSLCKRKRNMADRKKPPN